MAAPATTDRPIGAMVARGTPAPSEVLVLLEPLVWEEEEEVLVEVEDSVLAVVVLVFTVEKDDAGALEPMTALEAPAGREPWVGMTGWEVTAAG